MPRLRLFVAVLAATVAGLPIAAEVDAAATYQITDLGDVGNYTHAYGTALNDAAEVTGYAGNASSAFTTSDPHPFRWRQGTIDNLPTLGGAYAYANRIGNLGHVVGRAWTGSSPSQRGFIWHNGTISPLSTLGGDVSSANDLTNDAGKIVGWADTTNGSRRAVLWDETRAIHDLGSLPGWHDSAARSINDAGTVVGQVSRFITDGSRPGVAVRWVNGATQQLSNVDLGYGSSAADINAAGVIVGSRSDSAGASRGFIWNDGAVQFLGVLPGGYSSDAAAINDAGTVVGSATVPFPPYGYTFHAIVHDAAGTHDLNQLIVPNSGWLLVSASDINNAGQITGWGVREGQRRAFLLTPLPEPHALALALPIVSLLLYRRHSRP